MLVSAKMRTAGAFFPSSDVCLALSKHRLRQLRKFIAHVEQRAVSTKPLQDNDVLHDHFRDYVDDWIDGESDIEFVIAPYELEAETLQRPLMSKDAIDVFGLTSDTRFLEFRIDSTVSLPLIRRESDGDGVWRDAFFVEQLFARENMRLLFEPAVNAISDYPYRKYSDSRIANCLAVFCDRDSYAFLEDGYSEILDVAVDADLQGIANASSEDLLRASFRFIELAYDVLEQESGLILSASREDLSEAMQWEGLRAAYGTWMQRITKRNRAGKRMLGAAASNCDHAMKDIDYLEIVLTPSSFEEFADVFHAVFDRIERSTSSAVISGFGQSSAPCSFQFEFKEHHFTIAVV